MGFKRVGRKRRRDGERWRRGFNLREIRLHDPFFNIEDIYVAWSLYLQNLLSS